MSPLASAMLGDPQRTPPLASMVMANPVGTERIDQSLTNPTPGFQPAVDWGGYTVSRPMYDTAHAAINNAMGWMAPIKAFHGSPYDFSAFDMGKIGTGEGAQAYGHGLYFAGNEGVAQSYKNTGLPAFPDSSLSMVSAVHPPGSPEYWPAAQRVIEGWINRNPNASASAMTQAQEALAAVRNGSPGRMYEVNLNVEPGQLLDWDKPLSQQSPQVQALAQNHGVPNALPDIGKPSLTATVPPTGRDAYEYAAERLGDSGLAAQQMRDAGIPGIQYLDAGSRAAGDGTRNYVMFDPNLIDIVRKYGLAGAMLGAPAAAPFMPSQEPQQ